MKELITEARELCEKAAAGPWRQSTSALIVDAKGRALFFEPCGKANAALVMRSRTLIPELCDALENTEKQLQEQFDKTGAWLEEYNEMKIALEKAEEQNKQLMHEVCKLACESVERDKALARLEAEVLAARDSMCWIPVAERLPEEKDADRLGFIIAHSASMGQSTVCTYHHIFDDDVTTHWMPLPAPEKGE